MRLWSPVRLTQWLHAVSLLAARLAAGLTADVVKGEQDVVSLVHVDRQLDFNLHAAEQQHFTFIQTPSTESEPSSPQKGVN